MDRASIEMKRLKQQQEIIEALAKMAEEQHQLANAVNRIERKVNAMAKKAGAKDDEETE